MKKILVVDDERDIRNLLSELLSQNEFSVSTAASGEEALRIFKEEDFDLLMCDFRLGMMDGLEVLIRVKDIKPFLPVIIITGFADLKMAVQLMRQGAYDYLTKPLSAEEILNAVKNALTEAEIQKSLREVRQPANDGETDTPNLKESALKAELEVIQRVLKEVNYNRTKAAKLLGIDRKTLYNKMKGL